ncbi:MAG TPA: hypothetical protein VF683_00440 [Chthoniobacterales bacterium]
MLHGEIAALLGVRLATQGQICLYGLTPRQRDVLLQVQRGHAEKEIANVLGLMLTRVPSPSTS